MPRSARAWQGGYCYHVLNRGNDRQTVFHKEAGYVAFVKLSHEANVRIPSGMVRVCGKIKGVKSRLDPFDFVNDANKR